MPASPPWAPASQAVGRQSPSKRYLNQQRRIGIDMILLYPGPERSEQSAQIAKRCYTSLDGLRVGLLSNTKLNADEILLAIGDLLQERYAVGSLVHHKKPTFSLPAPAAKVDEMVEQCDVVIAGVGD